MKKLKQLSLVFLFFLLCMFPCACKTQGNVVSTERYETQTSSDTEVNWSDCKKERSMVLSYATQFSVDYYSGGYKLIAICDIGSYLLVPDGKPIPMGLPKDITIINGIPKHTYLAATSGMDFIVKLNCLNRISFSGTDEDGWYIDEAKQAMRNGSLCYAGKYNAPDVEKMLAGNCDLAIESTMILHNPEVKEQLTDCGIPVIVEHSSYEMHPIGRLEWIKFYGALFDVENDAEKFYQAELDKMQGVLDKDKMDKTVAFFYVTANGSVNVRKSRDYVSKMIELAGGTYVAFDEDSDESVRSTMNVQMETFYEKAKDADYLFYNSTIDDELKSIDDLLIKSTLFSDFKAVQEGHVYCTSKNMFQETTCFGTIITDIHTILTGETVKSDFLYPLNQE